LTAADAISEELLNMTIRFAVPVEPQPWTVAWITLKKNRRLSSSSQIQTRGDRLSSSVRAIRIARIRLAERHTPEIVVVGGNRISGLCIDVRLSNNISDLDVLC
jgi:hypothetical protein